VVEEERVVVAGMAVVLVGTVEATAIVATVPVARADLGVLRLGEAVVVVEGVAAGATVLEVTGPWEEGGGGGDCSNVGLRTRHGVCCICGCVSFHSPFIGFPLYWSVLCG